MRGTHWRICAAATIALAAACGEDFEPYAGAPDASEGGKEDASSDANGGTGGIDGGSGSGGSSGASGAGAGGGGGGAGFGCQPVLTPFEILGPDDLAPGQELVEEPIALVRHEGSSMVHLAVLVEDGGVTQTLVARSIRDNGGISAVQSWTSSVDGPIFETGSALSTEVSFVGIDGAHLTKITFAVDGQGITSAPVVSTPLGTPAFCETGGEKIHSAKFHFTSPSDYRVAVTCSAAGVQKLFVGGSATAFDEVDSGGNQDGTLIANRYVYSGNVHLIQNDGNVYRYGTNASQLATPHQLALTTAAEVETVGLTLVGLKPPEEGSVVMAMTLKSGALVPFDAYVAALSTSQYADLGGTLPAAFKPFFHANQLSDVPRFHERPWSTDGQSIVTAAAPFAGDRVLFSMFDRKGSPLVVNHEVVKASAGSAVVAVHAAQLGFEQLVVWMSEEASGTRRLMGQRLACGSG